MQNTLKNLVWKSPNQKHSDVDTLYFPELITEVATVTNTTWYLSGIWQDSLSDMNDVRVLLEQRLMEKYLLASLNIIAS